MARNHKADREGDTMRSNAFAVALMLMWPLNLIAAQARLPTDGGMTTSLGQPGPWLWSAGVSLGLRDDRSVIAGVGEGRVGLYHELLSKALGFGGLHGEIYNQSVNAKYFAGTRLRWVSQLTGGAFGVDYSVTDKRLRPILTYVHPIMRAGLFNEGSVLRLDLVAGPRHTVTVGVEKPIFRRIPMGSTRPRADVVRLPAAAGWTPSTPTPTSGAIQNALVIAQEAARSIQRLCVPWLDHKGGGGASSDAAVIARLNALKDLTSATGGAQNIDRETLRFHDAIDRAFSLAMASGGATQGDTIDRGRSVAARARSTLLREVIFPYNRLLGQVKDHDSTHGLAVLARGEFLRWLHIESGLPAASRDGVMSVFDAMLDVVEDARAASHAEWRTSRFVWLPLQYGLRAEQYDTQVELDQIVEQATAERFTEGNSVSYVMNEQFQNQLSRTIRSAKSYHVLWTHDFRGQDSRGDPDEMGFRHVLRSYLAALTSRVRAYDSTGTFPTYIILLDEWFYEVNDGRLWMDLLEDPTRRKVHLPARFAWMEDSLRVAQDSLRSAIAHSALLTAQRHQYGEPWIRNLVKVHVNITNAADPSFWSWKVVSKFPLPDSWMRDHRKIVFYDVSEADPFGGEAILTGAGIGEHYSNGTWEDRSLLVRGPALLSLKTAARDALLKQGIEPASIPTALQQGEVAADYAQRIRAAGAESSQQLRAVQLHNGTGFDSKQVNVAKAVLYTLMPAGSVIKIPDSLWNGTFWGSALVGCALRGVRVVVMAPSRENAPARAFGSMVRSRELLWRLVMASQVLSSEIAASGGMLRVGIYNSTLAVPDVVGRLRAVNATLARHAWLRDLFEFPPSVYPGLAHLADSLSAAGLANGGPREFASDSEPQPRPLLHLKANFLASRDAWRMMARPEWVDVTRAFAKQRILETNQPHPVSLAGFVDQPDSALMLGDQAIKRWRQEMTPAVRDGLLFYTILGSSNQNERSMVSDGEDALVLSAWPAVIPYLDLLVLVGQCEWIDRPGELELLMPRQGRLKTSLAHWFKFVF